jgi:hypothetical protein
MIAFTFSQIAVYQLSTVSQTGSEYLAIAVALLKQSRKMESGVLLKTVSTLLDLSHIAI